MEGFYHFVFKFDWECISVIGVVRKQAVPPLRSISYYYIMYN